MIKGNLQLWSIVLSESTTKTNGRSAHSLNRQELRASLILPIVITIIIWGVGLLLYLPLSSWLANSIELATASSRSLQGFAGGLEVLVCVTVGSLGAAHLLAVLSGPQPPRAVTP